MATFKMEDLIGDDLTVNEPLAVKKTGRGKKTVGEKGYQEHRSRQDTEELIKNILRDKGKPMTAVAIARACDRTASPHFRRLLSEMVTAGQLVDIVTDIPGVADQFSTWRWYDLP